MVLRGPKARLERLSRDERELLERLWPDKALTVRDIASRFATSPATIKRWAAKLELVRNGRAFGGAARKRRVGKVAFAGQELRSDPSNVYDRSTVNAADRHFVEEALEENETANPHQIALSALDKLHVLESSFAGASVLTDEGAFELVGKPDPVDRNGAEVKALSLRVSRRRKSASKAKPD